MDTDINKRCQRTLFIVLLVGAMAFCASWQLPKFLFQGSDSE